MHVIDICMISFMSQINILFEFKSVALDASPRQNQFKLIYFKNSMRLVAWSQFLCYSTGYKRCITYSGKRIGLTWNTIWQIPTYSKHKSLFFPTLNTHFICYDGKLPWQNQAIVSVAYQNSYIICTAMHIIVYSWDASLSNADQTIIHTAL